MADNLRAESLAKRRVVEFNIANCDRAIGAIEKDMRTLENVKGFGEHAASVLIPIPTTLLPIVEESSRSACEVRWPHSRRSIISLLAERSLKPTLVRLNSRAGRTDRATVRLARC